MASPKRHSIARISLLYSFEFEANFGAMLGASEVPAA
jgi:hypothetical protein